MTWRPPRAEFLRLPEGGVLRVHRNSQELSTKVDVVGPNRFDDPRPNSHDRYVLRYAATTLRGCLLELLAGFRPSGEAAAREAAVTVDPDDSLIPAEPWRAIADFLGERKVCRLHGPKVRVESIDDPDVQARLDNEPVVRALLDSPTGRAALAPAGNRSHLDGAAVRLSTPFGRDITQACSLALFDRGTVDPDGKPHGIHYRSRHDDREDCWALFDRAPVEIGSIDDFSPTNEEHRAALAAVTTLWDVPLPPELM